MRRRPAHTHTRHASASLTFARLSACIVSLARPLHRRALLRMGGGTFRRYEVTPCLRKLPDVANTPGHWWTEARAYAGRAWQEKKDGRRCSAVFEPHARCDGMGVRGTKRRSGEATGDHVISSDYLRASKRGRQRRRPGQGAMSCTEMRQTNRELTVVANAQCPSDESRPGHWS